MNEPILDVIVSVEGKRDMKFHEPNRLPEG